MLAEKTVRSGDNVACAAPAVTSVVMVNGPHLPAPSPALALRGHLEAALNTRRNVFRLETAGLMLAALLATWIIGVSLYASL